MSHLGLDEASEVTSRLVAQRVAGIDLIIDGHSHTVLAEPLWVNGALIVQTGEYLNNVGMVQIRFGEGKQAEVSARIVTKEQSAGITPDAGVTAAIDGCIKAQGSILSEVLFQCGISLDGERSSVRTGPTNLCCLVTTAMVDATGADLALLNGGAIRASVKAGKVTKGDIVGVLPFGNYIVTKKVKGSQIKAALEHGLSAYPSQSGGFPQVANVEYLLDLTKPAGKRVTHVWIKGVKLDPDRVYTVATNDFLAAGGDGYPFAGLPVAGEYQALDEALATYLVGHQGDIKYRSYTVKKGDVLWRIARGAGHFWLEIAEINGLKNPDRIYPGQKLLLPAWS